MVVQFADILRADDIAAHLVNASAGQLQSGRIRFRSLRQRGRFFLGCFSRSCGTGRSNLDASATATVAATATVTGGLAATATLVAAVVATTAATTVASTLAAAVATTIAAAIAALVAAGVAATVATAIVATRVVAATLTAAAMAPSVGLRFQADHDDGHGRESQRQSNDIPLHQKYLQ